MSELEFMAWVMFSSCVGLFGCCLLQNRCIRRLLDANAQYFNLLVRKHEEED